jgi:DNA-binding response OmpR family regulator
LINKRCNPNASSHQGEELSAVKILLIDNEEYSIIYREMMKQWGYSVTHVKNISQGRETFEKLSPDLIMLGDTLADGCSLEFCRELRARSIIPIILIDCLKADVSVSAGLEAGADEYLPKHCPFDYVNDRVKKLLAPVAKRSGAYAGKAQPKQGRIKWVHWISGWQKNLWRGHP